MRGLKRSLKATHVPGLLRWWRRAAGAGPWRPVGEPGEERRIPAVAIREWRGRRTTGEESLLCRDTRAGPENAGPWRTPGHRPHLDHACPGGGARGGAW